MADRAFPYPYNSDLHKLWGWGYRIERLLDEDRERTEYDWMIFRPCEAADNAMMRYSIDYPAVIAELRSKLNSTNGAFDDFLKERSKQSESLFSDWLEVLQSRIEVAAKLIAEREGIKPNVAAIPVSAIRSRSRDSIEDVISHPSTADDTAPEDGRDQRNSKREKPRLVVDLKKQTILLDGKSFDVKSDGALRWVKVLAEHAGDWISSSELNDFDQELYGARTDKLKRRLPDEIARLIESETGRGSRLVP